MAVAVRYLGRSYLTDDSVTAGTIRWSENAGDAWNFVDQPTAAAQVAALGISFAVEYVTVGGQDDLGLNTDNA